jgi:hypothetical protein
MELLEKEQAILLSKFSGIRLSTQDKLNIIQIDNEIRIADLSKEKDLLDDWYCEHRPIKELNLISDRLKEVLFDKAQEIGCSNEKFDLAEFDMDVTFQHLEGFYDRRVFVIIALLKEEFGEYGWKIDINIYVRRNLVDIIEKTLILYILP